MVTLLSVSASITMMIEGGIIGPTMAVAAVERRAVGAPE